MWVPAHLCLRSSGSACHLGTPADSKMMLHGVCPAERLSGSPLQGRSRSPLQGRSRSHCMLALICSASFNLRYLA